ncbi:hypothetical protein FGO68_gene873 [Halteria grandinella]|uniref:Delta(14)-sterol reductase n=1 Tax=Halteria grandinella TaxID=5974 RepID=A0A8J8NN22_HALGN|nr:hypothetical protein FGO68_gene873 [Halteria grandinella]
MSSQQSSKKKGNHPARFHYEFAGPYLGPLGMIIGLPVITFLYSKYCTDQGWPVPSLTLEDLTPQKILSEFIASFKMEVFMVYVAYWLYQAALYFVLPGIKGKGIKLSDGSQLEYPFNGLLSSLVTLTIVLGIHFTDFFNGKYNLDWIADNYLPLTTATVVFSVAQAIFLYAYSFSGKKLLAVGGNSGNYLYDFFIGRELNPRVFGLDLKYFNELRPGLLQWGIYNIAFAYKQSKLSPNGLPDAWMILVVIFESYYILDAVMNEPAILTTMDITTDGFGWMLSFGDLAWVPCLYSLQARYLSTRYHSLSTFTDFLYLAMVIVLGVLGMIIFRGANSQKDQYKRDPNHPSVKKLETIQTQHKPLLVGGWWGKARHINYLGDWLMSISWSLPCGFGSPLPYFYPVYFAVLLVHRDMRDEEKCAAKYGKAWQEYCRRVKYRIIPYIY